MVSVRRYHWITHQHAHQCPSCKLQLETTDTASNSSVNELYCVNDSCPVARCYCNGTLDSYSISEQEAFRCAEELLSTLGQSLTDFEIDEITSITALGVQLQKQVTTHIDTLPADQQNKVRNIFETFAEIERTLTRREHSNELQSKQTTEQVLDFNGVYIPYSEVLVYTVITNEFTEPRIIRYPTKDATYLNNTEIEPYEYDFTTELRKYTKGVTQA